jgi:sorbitol/mannitol transport system substrate-binding protein
MLNKRWMKVYVVLAAVLLVSAACGPGPTPEVIEREVTREVEKEVEVIVDPTACNLDAPASATSVDVIGWAFDITEFYANELEKCNAVDNLEVNVQLLDSAGAQEQVRLALSGGATSPYGIVHGANVQMVEWGTQDWLLPLNDLIDKYRDEYDLDDIPQIAWDGATIDGQIYGVPMVGNTLHLQYRTDLFEKHNLEPPTTYDEVIAACEVLKDEPSIDLPFTTNLHAGWAWELEFLHFVRAFGGDFLNEDNTPAFNGPEGVAAVEKMMEVADACMGPEGMTYSLDDSSAGIQNGALAFIQIWASRAAGAVDPEQSAFADVIGFAPAPAPVPGGPLGGSAWNDYYAIPAATDLDHDLLFRIIMEAVDLRSQQDAAEVGIVTRRAVAEAGLGGPYLPAASETIASGVGIYQPKAAIGIVRPALQNWLPLVGTGELTPQEALDEAAEEYLEEAVAQGFVSE